MLLYSVGDGLMRNKNVSNNKLCLDIFFLQFLARLFSAAVNAYIILVCYGPDVRLPCCE